jgi:hypothetical protein
VGNLPGESLVEPTQTRRIRTHTRSATCWQSAQEVTMERIKRTAFIEAPPTKVFGYLMDPK